MDTQLSQGEPGAEFPRATLQAIFVASEEVNPLVSLEQRYAAELREHGDRAAAKRALSDYSRFAEALSVPRCYQQSPDDMVRSLATAGFPGIEALLATMAPLLQGGDVRKCTAYHLNKYLSFRAFERLGRRPRTQSFECNGESTPHESHAGPR
jgi:hypothetical protein